MYTVTAVHPDEKTQWTVQLGKQIGSVLQWKIIRTVYADSEDTCTDLPCRTALICLRDPSPH